MPIDLAGRTALITGASAGLGVEFAKRFAARGSDLVLVARRQDRLEELAATLRREHGVTVTVIATDLARPGIGAQLHGMLAERGIRITTLVNNAGFATYGAFVDEEPTRVAQEIMLDVASLVDLSRAFLPDLLADGDGALINVASTAAFQPSPGMAVYGASKAFVLSFTEAVAHENRNSALTIMALCPGPTRTEFFDVVGTDAAAVGNFETAEQVIDTAMRALDRRRTPVYVVSGAVNRVMTMLTEVTPSRIATAMAGRMLGSRRPASVSG